MKCEVCSFDFGDKKEIRCPRCGAVQKCGMACSGNCLKCNMKRNAEKESCSVENKETKA